MTTKKPSLAIPAKTDQLPAFLTIRKFVGPSGVSEKHLRQLVDQGQLPFIRSGNRVLVEVDGALQALRTMASQST